MVVFHKLLRIARSSRAYKTEWPIRSVTGHKIDGRELHTDQGQRNFFVHIIISLFQSEVLHGRQWPCAAKRNRKSYANDHFDRHNLFLYATAVFVVNLTPPNHAFKSCYCISDFLSTIHMHVNEIHGDLHVHRAIVRPSEGRPLLYKVMLCFYFLPFPVIIIRCCLFLGKGIRLVGCAGGGRCRQGRLEVLYGSWGTVCDDDFGTEDARVACHSLGFG